MRTFLTGATFRFFCILQSHWGITLTKTDDTICSIIIGIGLGFCFIQDLKEILESRKQRKGL